MSSKRLLRCTRQAAACSSLAAAACYSLATAAMVLSGCDGPPSREVPTVSMAEAPMPKITSASEAIRTPVIPKLDPAVLDTAEIDKVLPAGPRCTFRYTQASPPVLAGTLTTSGAQAEGVVKINNRLVKVNSPAAKTWQDLETGAAFSAGQIQLEVIQESSTSTDGDRVATMHFSVQPDFHVGYKGWYHCDAGDQKISSR